MKTPAVHKHGMGEEMKTIYGSEEDSAILTNLPSSNGVVLNWLVAESSRWLFSSDEPTMGRYTPARPSKLKLESFSGVNAET